MSNTPHTWPRLFIQEKLSTGELLTLPPEQSHYLTHVLRSVEGDSVRIFNGVDGEWRAMITQCPVGKKKGLILKLIEQRRQHESIPDLWLCCAPIKRAHFDFMMMKATELGANVIQPILTSRTQIRESNSERLRAIAIEAAEQSERLSIPEIKPALALPDLVEQWPAHRLAILCAEFGDAQPVAQALSGALARARPSAAILTGPEGGFTQDEMMQIKALPEVLSIRLGPRILRADTAAIAAMSCWQALCGDWQNRDFHTRPDKIANAEKE
ncbi:MAG: 16S rRNA (uracil(1498)-N(3))-methyltransferase [Alphaproteobacteria bacterium]|nr:16S rRNA (uracil(1498)-N(3))-methyltransferase [Alphaproteobacteria bacterium]